MAKDKLTDYNATATLNTDIGGINIDEGMLPSNVNNAMREQMSHLADFAAGTTGINVLNLQDDDASASIKIQAPAAVTTTTTLTLPDGAGSANQSLTTNGSGTLSWSTRIGNVVEDTTPQLGGNLDTNGNDITGTGNIDIAGNIELAKDAPQIDFNDTAGGTQVDYRLKVDAGEFSITDVTNSYEQVEIAGGIVKLRHNGSTKVSTSASGIYVTGTITADGLTVDSSTGITVNGPSSSDGKLNLVAYAGTQNAEARISAARGNTSGTDSRLKFYTNNGTSLIERVDINDNGDISFYDDTGVTQGFYWDASTQRLGLGTTAPENKAHFVNTNAGALSSILRLTNASTTAGTETGIDFTNSTDLDSAGNSARISVERIAAGNTAMKFSTSNTVTPTERMRIDSSGIVTIENKLDLNGQLDLDVAVATNPALSVTHTGTGNSTLAIFTQAASNTYNMAEWRDSSNTGVLYFAASGNITNTNNSYGAISDVKLKENIADAGSQWDDIKAVKVRKYSFKTESSETANQIGVVAQELEAAGMNGLVVDNIDRHPDTFEDLGTITKEVKYSVLYMKALKALQEAMTRIETLETNQAALEARIAALEAN
jgi:hypothetical protein